MAAKLTDAAVEQLRALWDEGWSAPDLAAEFDVSERHVRRLVSGDQRPSVGSVTSVAAAEGVAAAVAAFIADLEMVEPGSDVLAATARVLAGKLDLCAVSESAAAAQAMPRLAAELVETLERLRAGEPREPDRLDDLRVRRNARRLAAAASRRGHHGNHNGRSGNDAA